jgi:predicted CXXCH cytochrome family protein
MTWTYSGNTELTVDITNRIATITPPSAEWTGSEVITFRATDPGLLWYDDPATFTVQPGANNAPTIAAGNTSVNPTSLARVGAATTDFSVTFTDSDAAGINDFTVVIRARAQFSQGEEIIADSIAHGVGGLTITDNGGGSYTASITWNPPDDAILGYYDLYTKITDGIDNGEDLYANNTDELLITNTGENAPPIVQSDATTASPAGIERVGANLTTISTVFQDGDSPGISAFYVNYKIRKPDNVTDSALVTNATHGTQGLTITDGGSGIYTASITWDPPDGQELGLYDIYFDVTDGSVDTAYDNFASNSDEIEVIDAAVNNNPTVVAGNTFVLPDSISRVGTDFTMIKGTFSDADFPGIGAFSITIKVQDPSSTEYTIVNAASNGPDVKVTFNGTDYEASVLWDPPDAQATGLYDLYFFVDDNNGGTIADGYGNNTDELNITNATPLGDGNLLRRTLDDGMCGGATSACHNIATHASQTCLTCHTPHGTPNIYLIRDTITTPTLGDREVIFKTIGVGDPYNDPDPVQGDNNHGAMADDSNTVQTEVCEVCHVDPIKYYRGDDSHTQRKHNNVQNCVASCHPHDAGFTPSGGGESSGGDGCGCHSTIVTQLTTSTTTYHHQLTNDNANYSAAAKTCLQCHVHHDIFRDDLNSGVGAQRAKNLRVSINITPVQGDGSVFLNSDYQSTGDGGICLSCHTSTQTKGYTQPDGTTETPAISKTDFDASTAHNYNATSSYGDGSSFNANCVKCHNDEMSKSKQTSTIKFSAHDSQYRRILDETGISLPEDPLEEDFCFSCHSTTSNPNAGSNLDKYGVKAMSDTTLAIETAFGRIYSHPTIDSSGVHVQGESGASDYADGNRHAECSDCHNPHVAQQGTHDGTTNLVSNALKGTWGVEPSYGAVTTPTDNANVFDLPTGYTVKNPAEKEYQICLKCHSNYTTLPSGSRNLAEELNSAYPSTHAILQVGDNGFCNSTTMNEPWGTNKINYCSDCHRSDTSTDPEGPHGSNVEHLLVATIVSNKVSGTPLCDVCHKSSVYWSGDAASSKFDQHPATQGQHLRAPGCFSCHMWDYSSTAGLGISTTDWTGGYDTDASLSPPVKIWVHGQNRKWIYNEQDGLNSTDGAATDQPVENFINGYIANMDHTNTICWTETCKVHSNKDY